MFDDKSHGRNSAVKREIAWHKTAFGNDFQARSRNRRGQMDLSKAKHYMRNQSRHQNISIRDGFSRWDIAGVSQVKV